MLCTRGTLIMLSMLSVFKMGFLEMKRPCQSVGYRALFVLAVHVPGSEQLCRLESVGHLAFLKANSESVVQLL